jgi:Xaa-Pro aminopeptidase
VGLSIHEAPGLGFTDVELRENEVVTVEPGLYDPEIGGIRIEDMVVVTKDGYRNLTHFPKEFVI